MTHDHAHPPQTAQRPDQHSAAPFWRSRYALGLLVFGAVAAYFLLSEHRAHFFGALPFLLLLACPLMHMFMHGGHGGHGGGNGPQVGERAEGSSEHSPAPRKGEQP
jgi:hypothetical protein